MRKILQKSIVWLLIISTLSLDFQPIINAKQAEAATSSPTDQSFTPDPDTGSTDSTVGDVPASTESEEPSDDQNTSAVDMNPTAKKIAYQLYGEDNNDSIIPIEKKMTGVFDKKIILNYDDYNSIKALACLAGSEVMPDFENDFAELFHLYPDIKGKLSDKTQKLQVNSSDDILKIKVENPENFQEISHAAQAYWPEKNQALIKSDKKSIACVLGMDQTEVENTLNNKNSDKESYNLLMSQLDDAINSLKIDIRVLKTLVYLVTPKSQGGAGHYRIRVNRLLSGYKNPKRMSSRESDAIRSQSSATSNASSTANMTAAELGMGRATTSSSGSNSNSGSTGDNTTMGTVEDANGTQYDAYLTQAENQELKQEQQNNISAHADGTALDISEIDDIRCTLVQRKRIGKDKLSKSTQRPIKLAWQTSKGYTDSGGQQEQQQDLTNVMKTIANDGIQNLVDQFGGDISDYQGDLSSANFNDVAMLLGRSLFSQVINSPSASLQGYNFEDTLQKMGSMYFADFLGLPRELFINRQYNSYDDFARVIGQAAVEQRLNIPIGSFDGETLDSMLTKVGQRKLEYEMGLDTGDLDNFASSLTNQDTSLRTEIVGRAVIENTLNLEKGSFLGASFPEVKKNIGKYKGDLVFSSSSYVDNALHLELGTTDKLKNGQMLPYDFIMLVGKTRMDDTAYGLKNFQMSDSAFELVPGTWDKALQGSREALTEIGIAQMSKSFTSTELQRKAFREWLYTNSSPVTGDKCEVKDPIVVPSVQIDTYKKDTAGKVIYDRDSNPVIEKSEYKSITLSEDKVTGIGLAKGDMYRLFGCSKSSGNAVFGRVGDKILFYAFANYALNPDDKVKIDLTQVNPQIKTSNAELQFYLTRIQRVYELTKRIKANWQDSQDDPEYKQVQDSINNSITAIGNIINDSMQINGINSIKQASKKIAIEADYLNNNVNTLKKLSPKWVNKINGTISDINELVRLTTEIIDGNSVPSSQNLNIKQIPTGIFTNKADRTSSLSSSGSQKGFTPNRAMLMMLLSKKVSPKDFFLSVGAEKIENELNLPNNSFNYYIQNYERKGLGSRDAFMSSVGQARIEEEFSMPSFYFQGPILRSNVNMPDFKTDYHALAVWTDNGIASTPVTKGTPTLMNNPGPLSLTPLKSFKATSFSTYASNAYAKPDLLNSSDQTRLYQREFALIALKYNNQNEFNGLVVQAQNKYKADMQTLIDNAGGNKSFETSIADVVANIETYKMNDGIRTPENDLLLRMGLTGSYTLDSLTSNNFVAWGTANKRAEEIDKKLGLKAGSTRNLITNRNINAGYSKDNLSKDEKLLLSGKMEINPATLDMFLQVLNQETSKEELKKINIKTSYNALNPYAKLPPSDQQCQASFEALDGNMVSGFAQNNSYLYVDRDGPHYFGNKNDAEKYFSAHSDKRLTYLQELSSGLSRITGLPAADLETKIWNYVSNENEVKVLDLDDQKYAEIDKNTGVSKTVLDKLFNKYEDLDANKPLVAYKKAVGLSTLKDAISARLFGSLGLNISLDTFGPDDFYAILNGDFKSLYKVAGAMIDQELNLPNGSVYTLLSAPNDGIRKCSLSELGANVLGRSIGLNYISLKGNIYDNVGRAKIEQTLGISRNSFRGGSVDELIDNISPIDFVLAFHIPMTGNFADGKNIDSYLPNFFSSDYVKAIKNTSAEFKLKAIKDYAGTNSGLPDSERKALDQLNTNIKSKIKDTLNPDQLWWKSDYVFAKDEQGLSLKKMKMQIASIDSTFQLEKDKKTDKGITELMLTGKQIDDCTTQTVMTPVMGVQVPKDVVTCTKNVVITPDSYLKKVSRSTVNRLALSGAVDFLGVDLTDEQKNAMKDIINNFTTYVKTEQRWGDVYNDVSRIFTDLNLDEKAKLDQGSFQQILNNPRDAKQVVLPQVARNLDERFGLTSTDDGSFTYLYKQYEAKAAERENECNEFQMTPERAQELKGQENAIYKSQVDTQVNNGSYAVIGNTSIAADHTADLKFSSESLEQLKKINEERYNADQAYHTCKTNNRGGALKDWSAENLTTHTALAFAANAFSAKLSGKIAEATKGTVIMPPADISKIILYGDMRYFWAATLAYGANTVINASKPDETESVPPSLRISYQDVLLMTVGSPEAEEYAADAATYDMLGGTLGGAARDYDQSFVSYRYGDVCAGDNNGLGGIFTDCLLNQNYYSNSQGLPREYNNLVNANNQTNDRIHGFSQDKQAEAQAKYAELQGSADFCYDNLDGIKLTSNNPADLEKEIDDKLKNNTAAGVCADKIDTLETVNQGRENAKQDSRKMFKEDLQFRMMDSTFWGYDHNVFPGFSYALIKGDAKAKQFAIATYIKNGLVNGEFFGQKVNWTDGIKDPVALLATSAFIYSLSQPGADKTAVFTKYVNSPGFDFTKSFIAEHSENWFGFKIDPELAGGLILGAATGDWGFKNGLDADQSAHKVGNRDIMTVGGWGAKFTKTVGFSWADKQLGWKPGTAALVYEDGRKLYENYNKVNNLNRQINTLDDQIAKTTDPELKKGFIESRDSKVKEKQKAWTAAQLIAIEIINNQVSKFLERSFGKGIADLEEKWGLVPGSLMMLTESVSAVGVAWGLQQTGLAIFKGAAAGAGPMLWMALAMFVAINLFGVYKVDVKCSADGYFPRLENPNPSANDITNLGIWDGKDPNTMQQKSIEAAQYKAKRLIADMLDMQNNPLYKDIVPNQIMTGRNEDVIALNASISANICAQADSSLFAISGICGGNTQAGVWANPQTTAYTHIGF
ncbi:MAG: hypothetical protein M1324_02685 [Patescibacteria group bacterium]|nr:hypothetical protein [Patescibacteria group bacterium]